MQLHKLLPAQVVARGSIGAVSALLASAFLYVTACATVSAESTAVKSAPSAPFKIEALGKGAVPLDGGWQFHAGDNLGGPSRRLTTPRATMDGSNSLPMRPWGTQRIRTMTGPGWYRRRIDSNDRTRSWRRCTVNSSDRRHLQLYWNGEPVGHLGSFPPHLDYESAVPAQTYGLGPFAVAFSRCAC